MSLEHARMTLTRRNLSTRRNTSTTAT